MALTPSNMLPLNTSAPNFDLPDVVSGSTKSLNDVQGSNGTVIMFICNHCPYVIHVQDQIASLADEYLKKGVGFVGISSNDVQNYPADSPDHLKAQAENVGFNFPYLFDENQEIAKKYDAACTPDFYVFNTDQKLVYRGRIDESRPNSGIPVTGKDLRSSLDKLINGEPQDNDQYPSIGCNIKWKA